MISCYHKFYLRIDYEFRFPFWDASSAYPHDYYSSFKNWKLKSLKRTPKLYENSSFLFFKVDEVDELELTENVSKTYSWCVFWLAKAGVFSVVVYWRFTSSLGLRTASSWNQLKWKILCQKPKNIFIVFDFLLLLFP